MKRWRAKLLLLTGAAGLALAIPAFSQDTKAPESLLPPGFGETPAPPPAQPAPTTPTQPAPEGSAPPASAPNPAPVAERTGLEGLETVVEDAALEDLAALAEEEREPPIEIPDFARRPTDVVGVLGPESRGLGFDAWGNVNGPFLTTLMRRLDAPLPSRWTSMLLRRALLSRVPAPGGVHPVDWVAERAWLLLRMGEADAARMLVQSIDVDQFTPRMFQIAVQTALATADPAALCPLVEPGRKTSDEPVWPLAAAMCAGLSGEAATAGTMIDQARRRTGARPIDVTLAEKVIGAGANTRRAVTVQWDEVDELNSWRFGMASATGLDIPARLFDAGSPQVRAWHARAPMVPLDQRVASAEIASNLGVFSNASLVEIYSLLADSADVTEFRETVGGRLRMAYVARTPAARIDAMRGLWEDAGSDPARRHARLILTATAASRIAPHAEIGDLADDLIASMLTAGHDASAARWSEIAGGLTGESGATAWALVALSSPRAIDVSKSRIDAFADETDDPFRAQMLAAALAGLGRLQPDVAADLGVDLNVQSGWSQAIERAVQRRQPATVALLAAVGMQTRSWRGVPPAHLYRAIGALRRVGLEYEARMIAAEAVARL